MDFTVYSFILTKKSGIRHIKFIVMAMPAELVLLVLKARTQAVIYDVVLTKIHVQTSELRADIFTITFHIYGKLTIEQIDI